MKQSKCFRNIKQISSPVFLWHRKQMFPSFLDHPVYQNLLKTNRRRTNSYSLNLKRTLYFIWNWLGLKIEAARLLLQRQYQRNAWFCHRRLCVDINNRIKIVPRSVILSTHQYHTKKSHVKLIFSKLLYSIDPGGISCKCFPSFWKLILRLFSKQDI